MLVRFKLLHHWRESGLFNVDTVTLIRVIFLMSNMITRKFEEPPYWMVCSTCRVPEWKQTHGTSTDNEIGSFRLSPTSSCATRVLFAHRWSLDLQSIPLHMWNLDTSSSSVFLSHSRRLRECQLHPQTPFRVSPHERDNVEVGMDYAVKRHTVAPQDLPYGSGVSALGQRKEGTRWKVCVITPVHTHYNDHVVLPLDVPHVTSHRIYSHKVFPLSIVGYAYGLTSRSRAKSIEPSDRSERYLINGSLGSNFNQGRIFYLHTKGSRPPAPLSLLPHKSMRRNGLSLWWHGIACGTSDCRHRSYVCQSPFVFQDILQQHAAILKTRKEITCPDVQVLHLANNQLFISRNSGKPNINLLCKSLLQLRTEHAAYIYAIYRFLYDKKCWSPPPNITLVT